MQLGGTHCNLLKNANWFDVTSRLCLVFITMSDILMPSIGYVRLNENSEVKQGKWN